jgi:hypothetical protein
MSSILNSDRPATGATGAKAVRRRLLIISPHFPPVNAPDLQRVRMSLPYYAANGWDPVVLAVHPDDVAATHEPELCATYPASVRVVYVRAWSSRWMRLVGVGNLGLRAWFPLLFAGTRLLRREKFDLVFFSTTQFITFTLGPYWQRRFGVPFVIDLQDPWRTDYYERPGAPRPPGGMKYRLARLFARTLEQWTYRRAGGFISVSARYLSDLAQRYPWFAAKPQETICFGATASDFELVRTRTKGDVVSDRRPGEIRLVYTGAAGPIMAQALSVLFAALRSYRERVPAATRFQFHFLGTSYAAKGAGQPSVLPAARACEVDDLVFEVSHRIGYLESLKSLLEADALLLLGSSDRAYSPSKLYPCFLSNKPTLSVVFRGSYLAGLLDELNCSVVAAFTLDAPHDAAGAEIHRFFDLALAGFPQAEMPVRREAWFNQSFLAGTLTRRQCLLFDHTLAENRPNG